MKYYVKRDDMENYFEPILSEEQLAAYMDGMLSTEESNMVEAIVDSNPEMVEIQETIDSVDNAYIYAIDEEVPIELIADDFTLPDIGYDYNYLDDFEYSEGLDSYEESESSENQEDLNDIGNFHGESLDMENDNPLADSDMGDISF